MNVWPLSLAKLLRNQNDLCQVLLKCYPLWCLSPDNIILTKFDIWPHLLGYQNDFSASLCRIKLNTCTNNTTIYIFFIYGPDKPYPDAHSLTKTWRLCTAHFRRTWHKLFLLFKCSVNVSKSISLNFFVFEPVRGKQIAA